MSHHKDHDQGYRQTNPSPQHSILQSIICFIPNEATVAGAVPHTSPFEFQPSVEDLVVNVQVEAIGTSIHPGYVGVALAIQGYAWMQAYASCRVTRVSLTTTRCP